MKVAESPAAASDAPYVAVTPYPRAAAGSSTSTENHVPVGTACVSELSPAPAFFTTFTP